MAARGPRTARRVERSGKLTRAPGTAPCRSRLRSVPQDDTLAALPPYSPQLNPVERLWLYLRETSLSLCVFRDRQAIIDACCDAWTRATRDPSRIQSLCNYPYIKAVSS